jgi:hypothetical protein
MSNTNTATVATIATAFNVDGSTVRRWTTKRHNPPCPHSKDGSGRLTFDPAEVQSWWARNIGSNGTAQTGHRPAPADDRVTILEAYRLDLPDEVRALDATVRLALLVATHHGLLRTDPDAGKLEIVRALAAIPKQSSDTWLDLLDEAVDALKAEAA